VLLPAMDYVEEIHNWLCKRRRGVLHASRRFCISAIPGSRFPHFAAGQQPETQPRD
jgi:hypothetical protein